MDSRLTKRAFDSGSMQTHWVTSIELLLRAGTANRVRPADPESSGRDLYGKTLLWFSEDHTQASKRRAQRQSQTDPKNDEKTRTLWQPTGSQYLKSPPKTHQISISSTGYHNFWPSTSLEYRYHVHPITRRFCLYRSRNRLVQSARAFEPPVEQSRNGILLRSVRVGNTVLWATGNLQHRSRSAIYIRRICECCNRKKYSSQHGWQRKSTRQYFCRTPLEVSKI